MTAWDDAFSAGHLRRSARFRFRNFFSKKLRIYSLINLDRRCIYTEGSTVSRNDESRRTWTLSFRHSDAALTLPDAITRGGTWRAPECTQCLPYWLACSVLRNVINTSLTHAPLIPSRPPAACNPSVSIALPFPLLTPIPREFACIRILSQSEKHADVPLDKYEGKGKGGVLCVRMRVGPRGMDAHTNATRRINHRGIMRMTRAECTRNDVYVSACAAMHRYLQR